MHEKKGDLSSGIFSSGHWMRRAIAAICCCLAALAGADTHYEVLGVATDVSAGALKKAYYGLARSLHPDKVTEANAKVEAELKFKRVAEAYGVLSDEAKRREYDQELAAPTRRQREWAAQQQQQQRSSQLPGQQQPGLSFLATSLDELQSLHDDSKEKRLKKHLLLALHDSRDKACAGKMRVLNFPYPFVGMSQDWHGVNWTDVVVAATHDVGPSLKAGRPSALLSAYEQAVGPATRGPQGVRMPRCPTIIFQAKGEALGQRLGKAHSENPISPEAFHSWAFSFLTVPLRIINRYPSKVRINWIHGPHVKEMMVLGKGDSAERTVYLSHTLHAERIDRKGLHISDNSSLLIFKVVDKDIDMIVPRNMDCLDLSADCEDWLRKGECARNAQFMRAECGRSCGFCLAGQPKQTSGKPKHPATIKVKVQAAGSGGGGDVCADDHLECVAWALQGHCDSNPTYMTDNCKRSCGLCGSCVDNATSCAQWKANGECETNAAYMRTNCAWSCGFCGGVAAGGDARAVGSREAPCVDDTSDCALWAASGECASNAVFMGLHCQRACGKCGADECDDEDGQPCKQWAEAGECVQNARFMSKTCRRSCGMCGEASGAAVAAHAQCDNLHKREGECGRWAQDGHCGSNRAWMLENCKRSCGLCDCADTAPKGCADWKKDQQCLRNRRFMAKHCFKTCGWCGLSEEKAGKDGCYDEDIKCEEWLKSGECAKNAAFMSAECMKSCGRCKRQQQQQQQQRTPPLPPPAAKPAAGAQC